MKGEVHRWKGKEKVEKWRDFWIRRLQMDVKVKGRCMESNKLINKW
jgi:hypothetical protein